MTDFRVSPGKSVPLGLSDSSARLQPNALGFRHVLWQALTHVAPAIALITSGPFIALYAGAALPLAFALAGIVALLVGNSIAELSKRLPSAGGVYAFASRGLGPSYGNVTAWAYLLFDPLNVAASTPFAAYYLQLAVKDEWGFPIPWQTTTIATVLLLGLLSFIGVRTSMRFTVLFGIAEIAVVLGLSVGLIVKHAHGQHIEAFLPTASPTGIHGLALGLIYAILAYAGFESVAPFAEETKLPRRCMPRAIFVSIVAAILIYTLAGYATVVGWGFSGISTSFAQANNPYYSLANTIFPFAAGFVVLAMANSALGGDLSSQNASVRVLYSMGRAGVMPRALSLIHSRYRTPWVAISLQVLVSLVLSLVLGNLLGPVSTFGLLGLAQTEGLIITYILASASTIALYRRYFRSELRYFRHVVLPVLSILILVAPLVASVWPFPAYPFLVAPFVVVGWMVVGVAVTLWLRARRPEALAAGSVMYESLGEPETQL